MSVRVLREQGNTSSPSAITPDSPAGALCGNITAILAAPQTMHGNELQVTNRASGHQVNIRNQEGKETKP